MDEPTANLKEISRMVFEHDKWIDGNGNKGAKARLAVIEEKINSVQTINKWILGTLICNVVVMLLTWYLP